LGVMQQGVPISTSTENLSANNVHQFSMKAAEEEQPEPKEADNGIRDLNQSGKAQGNLYVNAKGAQAKKQNSEKRAAAPAYKVK
ncbi:MAG: hypothetical protein LBH25_13185, partial [Fibromonadaceae bacterium]|nr:hypothetical protein [Fibromonadaceae bacterium]